MGDEYFDRGMAVLRRGGAIVHEGAPQSLSRLMFLLAKFALFNLLPNGKAVKGYGTHRVDRRLLMEDWAVLSSCWKKAKVLILLTGLAYDAHSHADSIQALAVSR